MALDLFETLCNVSKKTGITDLGNLGDEFLTTMACGEEGAPC